MFFSEVYMGSCLEKGTSFWLTDVCQTNIRPPNFLWKKLRVGQTSMHEINSVLSSVTCMR